MIANALRAEIDRHAPEMRRSNPLFSKAADGTLTRAHILNYLGNIHHLVSHTPVFLRRARDRARSAGDPALAAHYDQKLVEECGHDAWAERDIDRVSSGPIAVTREIVPSMTRLLAYLADTIDQDAVLYLAYILFAEYLTVLMGPEWLSLLEEHCGIPRSSMSVIDKHVDLDREHVEQALDTIDVLVGDARKLPQMRQVLGETMAYFEAFCCEITEEAVTNGRSSRSAVAHVSAA